VALPNVWKQTQTPHFDVYGRSELIAGRVSEAAEYHFAEIARWLGIASLDDWAPRCEIRIYADLDEFHEATGTSGVTRAVSRTRVQGDRVLLRQISAFQSDPWLLSATLPHELTHILLAEAAQSGEMTGQRPVPRPSEEATGPDTASQQAVAPPFALDEGLAVQVEPPARRLQYRRLLAEHTPNPLNLLQINQLIGDQAAFYARCDALAEFILRQAGVKGLIALCRRSDGNPGQALNQAGQGGQGGGGGGGGGGGQLFQDDEEQGGDEAGDQGNAQADMQRLITVITDTIEPDSWVTAGGLGNITPLRNQIIVRNSILVHQLLGGMMEEDEIAR
jgi:hypothetical protein